MKLSKIEPNRFVIQVMDIWANKWMLLTSGDFGRKHFNTMTVGWGSFGVMWSKPFVQVVVRPTRFTYQFMNQYDTFTLCAFPDAYREALMHLGAVSGRNTDKIAEAGLTPVAAQKVQAPAFAEAELILECRKMYWDDFRPGNFLDPEIEIHYPKKDYHRVYIGEVLAVYGKKVYLRQK